MARPWLSVIMPTYNGEAYLASALDSVRAQDDPDIEVIAVDDGSTDGTVPLLESYAGRLPLRVVRRRRVGNWVANTNHGLALARADHLCFLHQDDLWLAGRLAEVKRLLAHSPAALLLHPSWYIGPDGRRLGVWRCPLPAGTGEVAAGLVVERLLVQNFIAVPAPVFRREAALAAGGLDENLWFTADWDFWLKLAATGPVVHHPEPLSAFRIHPQSQTAVRTAWAEDLRGQLTAVLDRHLPAWERLHPGRGAVGRAARFGLEVTMALAACAHGQRADWLRLARCGLRLGPMSWHRFLRDSRIVERVGARLRLKTIAAAPAAHPTHKVQVPGTMSQTATPACPV